MNPDNNAYQTSAIGSDDFKDLIKSKQYIGKSLFIKDVMRDALKYLELQDRDAGENLPI